MTVENDPSVTDLPGANVPADLGLSSLGLLMQLGGTFFAACSALLAVLAIGLAGHTDGNALWILLVVGMCITRSIFHRAAGTQLLYGVRDGMGESTNAFGGMRRYVGVAISHSVVTGFLLKQKFDLDAAMVVAITSSFLVWPTVLGVLLVVPRFRRCANRLPVSEDKGFEGAAILMTVFGLCGAFGSGTLLFSMLKLPGNMLSQGPGVLLIIAMGMLAIRSIIHVQAGLSGLRETSIDRSVELANRYANFGVISAFCAGGALLLLFMSGRLDVFALAVVGGGSWMLLAWPLIVRRFYSDRQFADLLAGDNASVHRRAPDAGLTSLGWFLIAHACLATAFIIPQVILGDAALESGLAELRMIFGGFGSGQSVWWSVGLIALQAWAGIELVRMSPLHRHVGTVFGVVASGLTFWMLWPILSLVANAGGEVLHDEKVILMIGPIAMQLVVPVATLILVNRKIMPAARAVYRTKSPPT